MVDAVPPTLYSYVYAALCKAAWTVAVFIYPGKTALAGNISAYLIYGRQPLDNPAFI